MSIEGPLLIHNAKAMMSYTYAMGDQYDLVVEYLKTVHDDPDYEPHILGTLTPLRLMVCHQPTLAHMVITLDELTQWRSEFQRWYAAQGSRLKVKRGVSKQLILDGILNEIDLMIVALNQPEDAAT